MGPRRIPIPGPIQARSRAIEQTCGTVGQHQTVGHAKQAQLVVAATQFEAVAANHGRGRPAAVPNLPKCIVGRRRIKIHLHRRRKPSRARPKAFAPQSVGARRRSIEQQPIRLRHRKGRRIALPGAEARRPPLRPWTPLGRNSLGAQRRQNCH